MRDTRYEIGSALILAVVLTSLLAIVGVMFLMAARVDRMATSGISENRELNFAVETVVAKISQELVLDVPGVAGQPDYHDYPSLEDKWLANLEPYDPNGTGTYYWRQISDVTGFLAFNAFPNQNVTVKPVGLSTTVYVREYPEIWLNSDGKFVDKNGNLLTDGVSADADGDGIADSKWIKLDDITSNKGKTIFAAIRVVDNGGMLNVDTAYKFDPNTSDGSSQMQINLMGLSERDQTHTSQQKIDRLWSFRAGLAPNDVSLYEQNVVWQYGNPTSGYIPFDISDEMKLRNRYLLNYNRITTRIEKLWTNAYDGGPEMPLPTDDYTLSRWLDCATFDLAAPNDYDYRHIGTTYNMDRIINPSGGKMVNVNTDGEALLYAAIRTGLYDADPNFAGAEGIAAQMAVNLKDYSDNDANVSTINVGGQPYYGFEAQPFISEIGIQIGADPCIAADNHFAVELYNPFDVNIPLDDFELVLEPSGAQISFNPGEIINAKSRYVVVNHSLEFAAEHKVDNGLVLADNYVFTDPNYTWVNYNILLTRDVPGQTIYVDRQDTDGPWFAPSTIKYLERDDDGGHILCQQMGAGGSIGTANSYMALGLGGKFNLLPFDENRFVTVGDVSRMLIIGPGTDPNTMGQRLDAAADEAEIRVNLQNAVFANIFQYLTVFDPNNHGWPANETRIKGRININTAPWYVIAQLPWMQYNAGGYDYLRTLAIVADRDSAGAFKSIGELMRVNQMKSLGSDTSDNFNNGIPPEPPGPDFTDDSATNDFEERDLIFSRISNLVTVRSDVFTAYILVRIGADGPQKRVIAILDRSNVYSSDGKVRIVALHPVPDPR